ncbi:hypothetical protein KUTeg_003101 [Tegillarca granosa]|uniref:PH domain-containing protein n=1 Tax=Tegillarca granosa TaxID=220873 RepID=A0ABQ9FP28_TEGGR|nr:hypothetical protein KUTeg_003101 [Tegillarca granosa]
MEATSHSQFEGLLQKPARILGRTTKRSSCIGHIDISDIQTIRKVGTKDSQFEIITSEKPQIFSAESSDLCKEWITHIQHAMSTKGHEIPSNTGTPKSEHKSEKQTENFHIDLKSVKDKWKQRESKKAETRSSTTPSPSYSPKKLSLTHKGFPFNKDINEATENKNKEHVKITQDKSKQPPPVSSQMQHRDMNKAAENENKDHIHTIQDEGKEPPSVTSHMQHEDMNEAAENKNKEHIHTKQDGGKEPPSVTSQLQLRDMKENKDEQTDQVDTNIEEEPVVLRRKSKNMNGTDERKSSDKNYHKPQEPVISTHEDMTSVTPCSVLVDNISDKTSSVVDGTTVDRASSDVGNGISNKVIPEETITEKPQTSVLESSDIDTSVDITGKPLDCSTENDKQTSDDKIILRKTSSDSSKQHFNHLGTGTVSMVTARKTFPYTSDTKDDHLDEDAVVLRPKSTSSRLSSLSRSKSSSQQSTSDTSYPNGAGVTSEEDKENKEAEDEKTQTANRDSDSLPDEDVEDNPLLKVCKTEEIPSLEVVKSEELSAWEELRNYLTSNFGPLKSLANCETPEDRTAEDINPVLALKEYLKSIN